MTSFQSKHWRTLGIVVSIGLAALSYFAWEDRKFLNHEPESSWGKYTPLPKKIGFEQSRTVTSGDTLTVHSASAIELPNGDLRCYWFGGTREGHRDVSIWTSLWDHTTGNWGPASSCVDRKWLENETGLNIRKLGNPMASANGSSVDLFVVGVSMGGWSGSSLYHLKSEDGGLTFNEPKHLITSPFLNISTLGRSSLHRIKETDEIVIPAYHEFVTKYPTWIVVNKDREVNFIASTQEAKGFIQPSQIHIGTESFTFLRDAHDDGSVHLLHWKKKLFSPPSFKKLPIPNPNSSVAALSLGRKILLACNDHPSSRERLTLLLQNANSLEKPWHVLKEVETEKREPDELKDEELRYSYPWLMQTKDGSLHLFYTWNRREIRHLRFDGKEWPEELQPSAL